MNANKKILVLGVPRMEPHRPAVAPVIVGTICKNLGHDVTVKDLNIEFFNYCKKENIDYYNFNPIWDRVVDPTVEYNQVVDNFLSLYLKNVDHYDFIMISVFSIVSQLFTLSILKKLPSIRKYKIVLGGAGLFELYKGIPFDHYILQEKLADYCVKGEAEVTLPYILKDQPYFGINNHQIKQFENLDQLDILDYSLVDLDSYDYLDQARDVYIEGSRGCVRNCSYCDVASYWPKYRFRSGSHIANEMINHYEKYGVRNFYFTDSLVNGSLKAFDNMCETLAKYPFKEKITWKGQFIFRDKKTVRPEQFSKIKEAGGHTFFVGLETGSDRLRKEMGKNFTNDDTEYYLEHFAKNSLKVVFLMFPGYVTETYEDHKNTLSIFPRWQKYVASGTIHAMEFGHPLSFLKGAPVYEKIDEWQMNFLDSSKSVFWETPINPKFDFAKRVARQCELYEAAINYKYPIWRFESRAKYLFNSLKNFYNYKENISNKIINIPIVK